MNDLNKYAIINISFLTLQSMKGLWGIELARILEERGILKDRWSPSGSSFIRDILKDVHNCEDMKALLKNMNIDINIFNYLEFDGTERCTSAECAEVYGCDAGTFLTARQIKKGHYQELSSYATNLYSYMMKEDVDKVICYDAISSIELYSTEVNNISDTHEDMKLIVRVLDSSLVCVSLLGLRGIQHIEIRDINDEVLYSASNKKALPIGDYGDGLKIYFDFFAFDIKKKMVI